MSSDDHVDSVSIAAAAAHFGKSSETVRRWIRMGAPCVIRGEVGRGHGARVNISDLSLWRAARLGFVPHADPMAKIEVALLDVLKRDGGQGKPITEELGLSPQKTSKLLTHIYSRIERAFKGRA